MDKEIQIDVYLRNTLNGDSRIYQTTGNMVDGLFSEYLWQEGNYSCDCNRSLFLYDWDGEDSMNCNPLFSSPIIAIDKITKRATEEILYTET